MPDFKLEPIELSDNFSEVVMSVHNDAQRIDFIKDFFKNHFQNEATVIAKAGGRVNLIGEHVDYPDIQFNYEDAAKLYSLGMAIQNNFVVAITPNTSGEISIVHLNAKENLTIKVSDLEAFENITHTERENSIEFSERTLPSWCHHTLGAIKICSDKVSFKGAQVLLTSNVPHGAGVSNSAANCSALALVLNKCYELGLNSNFKLIEYSRNSENSVFAGGHCGWLDMSLIIHSKENVLTQICYADQSVEQFESKLPQEMAFVALNTNVPHVLAESDYVYRVAELEFILVELSKIFKKDVSGSNLGYKQINDLIGIIDNNEVCDLSALLTENSNQLISLTKNDFNKFEEYFQTKFEVPHIENHSKLDKKTSFLTLLKRLRHQCQSALIVPAASKAVEEGNYKILGELVNLEGVSLRMSGDFQITGDNGAQDMLLDIGFEVSKELNLECYGRMLGGGGGGNVLFYVSKSNPEVYKNWIQLISEKYYDWSCASFENAPKVSVIEPIISEGACLVS